MTTAKAHKVTARLADGTIIGVRRTPRTYTHAIAVRGLSLAYRFAQARRSQLIYQARITEYTRVLESGVIPPSICNFTAADYQGWIDDYTAYLRTPEQLTAEVTAAHAADDTWRVLSWHQGARNAEAGLRKAEIYDGAHTVTTSDHPEAK